MSNNNIISTLMPNMNTSILKYGGTFTASPKQEYYQTDTWETKSFPCPQPLETYTPTNRFIYCRGWLGCKVCWQIQFSSPHGQLKRRLHHFRRLYRRIILRNQPQPGLQQAHIRYIHAIIYIYIFFRSKNICTPVKLSMPPTLMNLVNMGRHPKNQRHETPPINKE